MINFEEVYNQNIKPKYGEKRLNENLLLDSNDYPHSYSIFNRKDMTDKIVYTIDPENCKDADDGFSIYYEQANLYLAIHIADPTEFINLESDLWNDIVNRVLTHYPSFNEPIHLMPEEILKLSSLTVENDNDEEIKNAISIITEIDLESYLPTNNVKLEYTKIKVTNENRLTYQEAADLKKYNYNLQLALMISESLYLDRSKKTIGTKLSELNNISVNKVDDKITFGVDSSEVILLKHMIGEFAIFANSFVGEYLKINLNGMGIFRSCEASDKLSASLNITGKELLNQIIDNGISAEYLASIKSHDLVGTPVYCHFTSPIRRLADCICHYLLKSIKLNTNPPWDRDQLDKLADQCFKLTKKEKNIQYDDNKFRVIQLFNSLYKNGLEIGIRITSFTGLFLNCIINKFFYDGKEYDCQISYCIKIRNKKFQNKQNENLIKIKINNVNPFFKFDENTLPDLDNYLKSQLE
tara:strand:- start:964 stop:2367 length:1404 start_codon:yes stop_codon:yes gene_type:complete